VAQLPHVRPTFTKRVTEEEKHKKKKNISPLPPAVKEEVKEEVKCQPWDSNPRLENQTAT
jgi:hypothetical protein